MLTTTLNKIWQCHPGLAAWDKLLKSLGKTEADDEPITLEYILESNGLDNALWVLRTVDGYNKAKRLLACNYAESFLPLYEAEYPGDTRLRLAIEASRRFAWGRATEEELEAAEIVAQDAWGTGAAVAARGVTLDAAVWAVWAAASAAARAARAARATQAAEFLKFCRLEGEYGEVSKEGEPNVCLNANLDAVRHHIESICNMPKI